MLITSPKFASCLHSQACTTDTALLRPMQTYLEADLKYHSLLLNHGFYCVYFRCRHSVLFTYTHVVSFNLMSKPAGVIFGGHFTMMVFIHQLNQLGETTEKS